MKPTARLPLPLWQRSFQHLANVAVGGTGLVYFVMKWLLPAPDEWAVVNHPWQPALQHLHVLLAPLLVFAMGLLWQRHVAPGIRGQGRNRRSGLGLALGFAPMAASGYLLQVSVDEIWRSVWAWLHVVTGLGWVLGYGIHWAGARRGAARRLRAVQAQPPGTRRAAGAD